MDYTLTTTAASFDTDVAAQTWTQAIKDAVAAAKPLADLGKAPAVLVNIAVSSEGGWCVVRIAPFNPEA